MELLLCELSVGELTALFCTIIFVLIPLLIWALCRLQAFNLIAETIGVAPRFGPIMPWQINRSGFPAFKAAVTCFNCSALGGGGAASRRLAQIKHCRLPFRRM